MIIKKLLDSPSPASLRVKRDDCDEVTIRVSITENKFTLSCHHNLHILSHLQIIFTFNFKQVHN